MNVTLSLFLFLSVLSLIGTRLFSPLTPLSVQMDVLRSAIDEEAERERATACTYDMVRPSPRFRPFSA